AGSDGDSSARRSSREEFWRGPELAAILLSVVGRAVDVSSASRLHRPGGDFTVARGARGEEIIVVTTERFAQGMTPAQYLDQMGMNKDRLVRALSSTTVGAPDLQVFERYAGTTKVLVITEDWCGTALGSLPYVFKLAEAAAPGVEVRVFLRDANLD